MLINDVNTLKHTPDEVKRQLVEYLHDFTVTDTRLKSLNDSQKEFHDDVRKYLTQIATLIRQRRIVVDEQVINDIKAVVLADTGFNLKDYISDVQREAVTDAWKHLSEQQTAIMDRQDGILENTNALARSIKNVRQEFHTVIVTMCVVFALGFVIALAVMLPAWERAILNHPFLTGSLLLVIVFTMISLYSLISHIGDDEDD